MTTDVADIARTVDFAGRRWRDGERRWNEVWEVMARQSSTVGQVIEAFRQHLGGPKLRLRLPSWLMDIAAAAGDLVAHFGWSPPLRTTALQEMRRGVTGDPEPWIAATGIEPASLHETMQRLPSTVQERWFARLYLVKPLVLVVLAVFWIASGLIALAVAFDGATAIFEVAWLSASACPKCHSRQQSSRPRGWCGDRLQDDMRHGTACRDRHIAVLYDRRCRADARRVDRAAWCSRQDGTCDRPDGCCTGHAGGSVMASVRCSPTPFCCGQVVLLR